MAVVGDIQSIGQPEDRRQLNRNLLFGREKVAQSLMASRGQCTAMETRDNGCPLHVFCFPPQRRTMGFDQFERGFMMPFISFRLADIVQKSGHKQATARVRIGSVTNTID
jgi:hypothetical protein